MLSEYINHILSYSHNDYEIYENIYQIFMERNVFFKGDIIAELLKLDKREAVIRLLGERQTLNLVLLHYNMMEDYITLKKFISNDICSVNLVYAIHTSRYNYDREFVIYLLGNGVTSSKNNLVEKIIRNDDIYTFSKIIPHIRNIIHCFTYNGNSDISKKLYTHLLKEI